MFNYNPENNNNNSNNNNYSTTVTTITRDCRGRSQAGVGGILRERAVKIYLVAAGARVNLSRRHISKWRRLIDISADYFMAAYTHTHTPSTPIPGKNIHTHMEQKVA